MSGPDLLERTRMALAEVGHDVLMRAEADGSVFAGAGVPLMDLWRATSIARSIEAPDEQICWLCSEATIVWGFLQVHAADRAACLADRPLVRDCGVTR